MNDKQAERIIEMLGFISEGINGINDSIGIIQDRMDKMIKEMKYK